MRLARLLLPAALLLAAPCLAADPVVLPGGQSLARGGLSADGRKLLTVSRDERNCWSLHLLVPFADSWAPAASARREPPADGLCPRATATLAGDGARVLVAEPAEGRAEVFRLDGNRLVREGELRAWGLKGFDNPPPALALSADGSLALVGAANYDCKLGFPAERCGTAFLYAREGTSWQPLTSLAYPEPRVFAVDFGTSAALSADGRVAVVGGRGHAGDPGIVYVYRRRGDGWSDIDPLTPDATNETAFGRSVAVNMDGSLIAVGGNRSVYLFVERDRGYARALRIGSPGGEADGFGIAVVLSADGTTLVVGAPRTPCGGEPRCGAAYLYRLERGDFRLERRLASPVPVPFTDFGHVLALDAGGSTVAVQGHRPYLFAR